MSSITFQVPYFFDALYVPLGKRKSVGDTFGRTMEVEIEDLTSDEVQVAVRVTRTIRAEIVTRDFVAFDGSFYTISTQSPWRNADEPVTLSSFEANELRCYRSGDLKGFAAGRVRGEPEGTFSSIENFVDAEHWNEAIEAKQEEVRLAASNLIFVDGVLHRKVELPKITASVAYGYVDRLTIDIGEDVENCTLGTIFELGDKQAADAWAEDRRARQPDLEVDDRISVEVLQPGLLPDSTLRAEQALGLVSYLLENVGDLNIQSDDYILAFVVARRAFNAAREESRDDTIGEMFDAWEALYRIHMPDSDERAKDVFFVALMGQRQAWEDRPIIEDIAHTTVSRLGTLR